MADGVTVSVNVPGQTHRGGPTHSGTTTPPSGGSHLPFTGLDVGPLVAVAAALVVVGMRLAAFASHQRSQPPCGFVPSQH